MTTAKWYGKGLLHVINGDVELDVDTMKAAIVTSAYTPNQDTDEFWSTPQANEAVGTGYTAGGQTVTVSALAYDASTNKVAVKLSAPVVWDATGGALAGRYVVFYKDTGSAATSPVIGWQDGGATITATNDNWTFTPDAGGILDVTAA